MIFLEIKLVIVFIVVIAAAYAAPSQSGTIPVNNNVAVGSPFIDGHQNSHDNFGYVYDTASNVIKRIFIKN